MNNLDKHKAKVRKEVRQRGLTSFMNQTKWLELQKAIVDELPFPPPFQRKDVLEKTPEPSEFESDVWYHGDWTEGVLPFHSIEWLRIRPRYLKSKGQLLESEVVECGEELRRILLRYHIPFKEPDDSIWIYGYAACSPV
jgi:hypothetical protein